MYQRFFKRALDISLSLIAILILSWLILLILIGYILQFQFPILFTQSRIGKNNQSFIINKFRTLSGSGTSAKEHRRFWWGDVLRGLSLDELPQLWNVLIGEMSLIGPRPLPVSYLPFFSEKLLKRHDVRPGITGWAQVNGRNSISWKEKFEFDMYYVNNLSFKLDLLILLKTVWIWISFHKDVSLNEEEFKGV